MTTKDEAMKLAVEALKDMNCGWKYIREVHGDLYGVGWDRAQEKADDASEALRQALDQPEQTVSLEEYKRLQRLVTSQGIRLMEYESRQEPVAWMFKYHRQDCFSIGRKPPGKETEYGIQNLTPLYTAPSRREWVGLTDEEILEAAGIDGADTWVFETAYAIEAKLKEKNT